MKYVISNIQLFFMMVLASLSGGTLFFLAAEVKQDAWLALLFSMFLGIIQILVYTYLFSQYPQDTIITYMPKIFGKVLGNLFNILFIARFAYLAGRLIRDNVGITLTTVMPSVPLYAISLIFIIPVLYSTLYGIENFFRVGEISFVIFMTALFLQYGFVFFTKGISNYGNLKPILENGLKPVIMQAFPDLLVFPYGTNVLFAMFFPYLDNPKAVHKTVIYATVATGITLALNTILIIAVLGVDFASASIFPFLETIRHVKIGFIDRIDIFVIVMIVLGGFIKITVSVFATIIGISQLFKSKKEPKWLCALMCFVIYLISIFSAPNYLMHLYIGLKLVPIYIFHIYMTIPILAIMVHLIRKAFSSKGK